MSKKILSLAVRLSPEEHALLKRLAEAEELTISTWVRQQVVKIAKKSLNV